MKGSKINPSAQILKPIFRPNEKSETNKNIPLPIGVFLGLLFKDNKFSINKARVRSVLIKTWITGQLVLIFNGIQFAMKYLIILLFLSLFDCSKEEQILDSTFPELLGSYYAPNSTKHYWTFDHTNIARYHYGEDEFEPSNMQWKVEAGKFHTRIWEEDGKWNAYEFRLSGDSLFLESTLFVKE